MSVVRIAKQAGVSIATVSRVMTKSRHVQPELAAKVRSAIEELGLPPRHFRQRDRRVPGTGPLAKTIGIVTLEREYRSWFSDPVIAALVAEITCAAADQHVGVLLAEMPDAKKICPIVEQHQIDGALVLISSESQPDVAETLSQHVPVVRIMGAQLGPVSTDQVTCDHMSIGHLAAKYLIEKGCTELAFMTLNPEWIICQLRAQGFFSTGDLRGIDPAVQMRGYFTTPATCVDHSYGALTISRPDWGQVMKEFIARRPTGLFVAREAELNQVYRMLHDHGIKPGRDLTVISCDNCDTWLDQLDTRPATIDLGLPQIAQIAVEQLIQRVNRPNQPLSRTLINPRLVLPGA